MKVITEINELERQQTTERENARIKALCYIFVTPCWETGLLAKNKPFRADNTLFATDNLSIIKIEIPYSYSLYCEECQYSQGKQALDLFEQKEEKLKRRFKISMFDLAQKFNKVPLVEETYPVDKYTECEECNGYGMNNDEEKCSECSDGEVMHIEFEKTGKKVGDNNYSLKFINNQILLQQVEKLYEAAKIVNSTNIYLIYQTPKYTVFEINQGHQIVLSSKHEDTNAESLYHFEEQVKESEPSE